MLVTGLLCAGGWAWLGTERLRRNESIRREVNRALHSATTLRDQARLAVGGDRTLWVQAIEAARRAESLLSRAEGDPELRDRVRSILSAIDRERNEVESTEKERRMVERLAEIHNDLGVHNDTDRADAEYSAAFHEYGVDLDATDPAQAGARLAARPVAVELANALDQWVFLRRMRARGEAAGVRRLVAVAKAADPDPWRNRLRETLGRITADTAQALDDLERLAATAKVDQLPEASMTRLAFALSSLGRREMAITLLRRTRRAPPGRLLGQRRPRPRIVRHRPTRRGGPILRRRSRHSAAECPRSRFPGPGLATQRSTGRGGRHISPDDLPAPTMLTPESSSVPRS